MRHWTEKTRRQALVLALTIFVAFALGSFASRWLIPITQNLIAQTNAPAIPNPPESALKVAEQLQEAFVWVAQKVEPSTVTIMTPGPTVRRYQFRFPPFPSPDPFEEFFRRFFERGIP